MRPRQAVCGAVATALLVAGAAAPSASAARTPVTGVTRATVTVTGMIGTDPASVGADVGAQARFARANRRRGVAGRTIRYAGNAPDPTTAAASAFAVVPAVGDAVDAGALAAARVPFVGAATTPRWDGNRYGFGVTGAQAALQTRTVSPVWGRSLRSLLGAASGAQVTLAVDAGELGAARAEQARVSLRAAGFRVTAPVTVPAPPSPLPDLVPVAGQLATGSPAVVMLLTSPPVTTGVARLLAQIGFTGTIATDAAFYQPTTPAIANGMTVLVPFAPFEQPTRANRRLAADVEAFAPGTELTPGVAAGYWSADLFLRALAKTGRRLTRERFVAAARALTYHVPSTVGPVVFPAMQSRPVPCGALVQSDGTRYLVVEPYTCSTPIAGGKPGR